MYLDRLNNLKKLIQKEKLDGVLVSSVSNITYLTGYSNFSIEEREAFLLVTPKNAYIFTDRRYCEAIKKRVPHFELIEITSEAPLKKILESLKKKHNLKKVGVEEGNLTFIEHKGIKKVLKSLKHFEVHKGRVLKTSEEVEKIRKACEIGDKAFEFLLDKIKIGVSEKEIANELWCFVKEENAEFSFDPIIAFGANSSVPHHHTGNKKLGSNDKFVLLDFGVKFEDYCSDMTRTVFFGTPTDIQKEIYETVKAAQQKAVDYIKNNVGSRLHSNKKKETKLSDIDKAARDYIINKGYPNIPHSLGHGIGLQVHERPHVSPKSSDVLEGGMVFSIEPGIYIEDFGGVRIEDLFYFNGKDLVELTHSKRKLIELK